MSDEATLDELVEDEERESHEFVETAAGKIPVDWDTVNVEKLCELRNGKATDHTDIGEQQYLVYGSNGPIGSYSKSNFDGGLIFGRVGAVGEVERIRESVWVSDNAIQAIVSDKCNTDYLYYFLSNKELASLATKTAQPLLNQSTIGNVSVPSPPLSEQRKIATVLYTVDRAIEKNSEIIDQIQQIKEGVRRALIPAGIRDHEYTSIRLGPEEVNIPSEWKHMSLSSVCQKITDGTHETPNVIDEGYPFVTSEDVNDGRIDFESGKYVSKEEHKEIISRSKPEKGDILYTHIGSIGDVAQVEVDFEFSIKNVALFKPNREIVSPDYLEIFLETNIVGNAVYRRLQGGVQDFLSITDLNKIPILIPSKEEQKEIVEVINGLSELKRKEQAHEQQLKRLKQGLMQDLLSGTVRTTDTNIQVPDEIAQHG